MGAAAIVIGSQAGEGRNDPFTEENLYTLKNRCPFHLNFGGAVRSAYTGCIDDPSNGFYREGLLVNMSFSDKFFGSFKDFVSAQLLRSADYVDQRLKRFEAGERDPELGDLCFEKICWIDGEGVPRAYIEVVETYSCENAGEEYSRIAHGKIDGTMAARNSKFSASVGGVENLVREYEAEQMRQADVAKKKILRYCSGL